MVKLMLKKFKLYQLWEKLERPKTMEVNWEGMAEYASYLLDRDVVGGHLIIPPDQRVKLFGCELTWNGVPWTYKHIKDCRRR
jgi:hypothetical protein